MERNLSYKATSILSKSSISIMHKELVRGWKNDTQKDVYWHMFYGLVGLDMILYDLQEIVITLYWLTFVILTKSYI